jgi:hypothetical protein
LIQEFIPEAERICVKYFQEHKTVSSEQRSTAEISCLQSVRTLKLTLANTLGEVLGDAVATILQQNMGSVVNHGLNRTINHVGRTVFSKHMRTHKTLEDIKAGQSSNYIRHVELSVSENTNTRMITSYAKNIKDTHTPGSLLEIKAAVELKEYGRGVTIYEMKKGKPVMKCSIDPSDHGRSSSPNIELVYTPPSDKHSPGHYDVLVKGKVVKVHSDASNCLFQAYMCASDPHLPQAEQRKRALVMRQKVVESFRAQPELWNDHIHHRVELERVRKGNHFAMLGAGPKNEKTKVHPDLYEERIKGNRLHTVYVQDNGVSIHATRVYRQQLKDENGFLVDTKGSSNLTMMEMTTRAEGLNFTRNVGRCFHTLPLSGMIKRYNASKNDSEVSYHAVPSEAGVNAGDRYGTAMMTSPHYNKLERDIWKKDVDSVNGENVTIREWIGDNDFSMTVKANMNPLVPTNFDSFFSELNRARLSTGREEVHETNKELLRERLIEIQKIDPRAYRVENLSNCITVGGVTHTVSMETDYDLHVPERFTLPNQQLRPREIKKAMKKVQHQAFNQAPRYRKLPARPDAAKVKKFQVLKRNMK